MKSSRSVVIIAAMRQPDGFQWDLYQQMFTIRRLEESLLSLYDQGLLFGTVHTCIGQEAIAVGVINALDRSRDVIWSNHRGHGHFVAYCDDVEGLIAEIMGRATGVCGGVGGTQHLHKDNFYTNGILGGTVPCAVGSALAEKTRRSNAIVTVFLGDGAFGEGVVYESMNIAALWNLPVLFVVELNGFAQSTPTHLEHAGDLSARAAPFGIPSRRLLANDVCEVYRAAQQASGQVRGQGGPFFLALDTYRIGPHSKGDDPRDAGEIARHADLDPLPHLRNDLINSDPARLESLESQVTLRLEKAIEAAQTAPYLETAGTPSTA